MAIPEYIISTDNREKDKALPFWEKHLHQIGLSGKLVPQDEEGFFASAASYAFGKSNLYFHKRSSSVFERTKNECMQSPSDFFILTYMLKGEAVYEQGGREAHVRAEDCFLTYSGEPFRCNRITGSQAITLFYPSSFIQNWVPNPCDMTAVPFAKHSGWGMALAATIKALSPDIDDLAVPPDAIVDQINCLLALAAGKPTATPGTYAQAMLTRLRQSLKTHYNDPDFDPADLAKEQGISTRTLFSAFAKANTSFRKELLSCRLEKARQLLEDVRFVNKSVAEISSLVGYIHASHFITHFRKFYGASPAVFRKKRNA